MRHVSGQINTTSGQVIRWFLNHTDSIIRAEELTPEAESRWTQISSRPIIGPVTDDNIASAMSTMFTDIGAQLTFAESPSDTVL